MGRRKPATADQRPKKTNNSKSHDSESSTSNPNNNQNVNDKNANDNDTNDMDSGNVCAVCTETIELVAYGECNHAVCHLCCLRMRVLYRTRTCALCKAEQPRVVIAPSSSVPFASLQLRSMPADHRLALFCYNEEIKRTVDAILRFNCPHDTCDYAADSWKDLRHHVQSAHNLLLCEICTKNRKIFAHEHQLYTHASLRRHIQSGDPYDPSFRGHPQCAFCRQAFYSDDELFDHCRQKHETCFLCDRSPERRHQYYRDYNALEKHFRDDHYACRDPECLEKKFIVFATDIDLKAHIASEHADKLNRTQQRLTRRVEIDIRYDRHASSASTTRGSESSQSSLNPRPPSGFGRLSSTDRVTSGYASATTHSIIHRTEWPDLQPHPSTTTTTSSSVSSSVSEPHPREPRITHDDITAGLIGPIGTWPPPLSDFLDAPSTRRHERHVTIVIAAACGGDSARMDVVKMLYHHYLRGVIVAEKFLDEVKGIVCNNGGGGERERGGEKDLAKVLGGVLEILPDRHKTDLRRVMNDRRVEMRRQKEKEEENGTIVSGGTTESDTSDGKGNRSGKGKAKVLVIKSGRGSGASLSRLNYTRANTSSKSTSSLVEPKSKEEQNSGTPEKSTPNESFPPLPATTTSSSSKKKKKTVLMSTGFKYASSSSTTSSSIPSKSSPWAPTPVPPPAPLPSSSTTTTITDPMTKSMNAVTISDRVRLGGSARVNVNGAEFPALPSVSSSSSSSVSSLGGGSRTLRISSSNGEGDHEGTKKGKKNVVMRFG